MACLLNQARHLYSFASDYFTASKWYILDMEVGYYSLFWFCLVVIVYRITTSLWESELVGVLVRR